MHSFSVRRHPYWLCTVLVYFFASLVNMLLAWLVGSFQVLSPCICWPSWFNMFPDREFIFTLFSLKRVTTTRRSILNNRFAKREISHTFWGYMGGVFLLLLFCVVNSRWATAHHTRSCNPNSNRKYAPPNSTSVTRHADCHPRLSGAALRLQTRFAIFILANGLRETNTQNNLLLSCNDYFVKQ